MIRYLLHKGANIHAENKNGKTALHHAHGTLTKELANDALAEHADGPVKFKRYARLAWEQGHTVAARTILESYCDGF